MRGHTNAVHILDHLVLGLLLLSMLWVSNLKFSVVMFYAAGSVARITTDYSSALNISLISIIKVVKSGQTVLCSDFHFPPRFLYPWALIVEDREIYE